MQIVTCPAGDAFEVFTGGVIALRAAAWMAGARGTLSEVVSADAVSGSYVQDTQTVSWAGTDHLEYSGDEADDTIVIDASTLPLETGLSYYPFITVRLQGTAAGNDDGRRHESFWYYDREVFAVECSDNNWASVTAGSQNPANGLPRLQEQFSLIWLTSGRLDDLAATWRFRAWKRATSGGDVAIQIEQIILIPWPGGFPSDFRFDSTFGTKPAEALVETSLESGIYTLDAGQPRATDFRDVSDLQDAEDDPEASALYSFPPIASKSVFYLGGGIVFVYDQEVEDDQFSRTVAFGTDWGDSPYEYPWQRGSDTLAAFYAAGTGASVDGTTGFLGPVHSPFTGDTTAQRSLWQLLGKYRNVSSVLYGPTLEDGRDWRIRSLVSVDALPEDMPVGELYPEGETGRVQIDVGQLQNVGSVESGYRAFVVARLDIDTAGAIELRFGQFYNSQALAPLPNPPPLSFGTPQSLGTYTPGDKIWVEYARQGYNVYAKAWYDGDAEPGSYQVIDRVRVPHLSAGVGVWDDYTYGTEQREDQAWLSRYTDGLPGVRIHAQGTIPVTLACEEFHVHFHADGAWEPTDVFLRVNEAETATVLGDELNMGTKSQNWVLVGDRAWPLLDIYQWNSPDSQPLQWMTTGLTYGRVRLFEILSLSHLRVANRYGDRVTVRSTTQ